MGAGTGDPYLAHMMHRLAALLLLSLFALPATVAPAGVLDPSHPGWHDARVDRGALATYLSGLELARKGQPRPSTPGPALARTTAAARRPVLVVPVLYAGDPLPAPATRAALADALGGTGEGSLAGYWRFASGGALELEVDVLPWVRLPGTLADYANVVDGRARPAGPPLLVADLLPMVRELLGPLDRYDDDGPDGIPGSGDDDGIVDHLLVLHPGDGFENGADPALSMLAHQGRALARPDDPELGARFDPYVLASWRGPLGVWCHEFGHLLGLEDLYDLDLDGARGGLGLWSLMSGGTWAGDGARPSHLDAWSRRTLGWDEGPRLATPAGGPLPAPSATGATSWELRPFGDWGREHFLVERREPRPGAVVDGALPGGGMLLLRVDPGLRRNRASEGYWVSLLQADGRDDLGDGTNTGDAGDPFGPGDAIDGSTVPSTDDRSADPSALPPRLEFGPDAGRVRYWPADRPALRLVEARFEESDGTPRVALRPGEAREWLLRFESQGPAPPAWAAVELVAADTTLTIAPGDSVGLVASGASWIPDPPVVLRDRLADNRARAVGLRLQLRSDGGERTVELGLPVQREAGLGLARALEWEARVAGSGPDSTRFVPLGLGALPVSTTFGWETRRDGGSGYGALADCRLRSPWFDPGGRTLSFWSGIESEGSIPGEFFDGATVELYRPDHGWYALGTSGPASGWIADRSGAAGHAQPALGGSHPAWGREAVALPRTVLPARVRLRFSSDATLEGPGWRVAQPATSDNTARATLSVVRDPVGTVRARASVVGDVSGFSTARFRWRRPGGTAWQVASGLLSLPAPPSTVSSQVELPAAGPVQLALFAELAGGNPPGPGSLQLGTTGYDAGERGPAGFRVLSNPVRGAASFVLPVSAEARRLRVVDLRGRLVRSIPVAGGAALVEWDLRDGGGSTVAAGNYLVLGPSGESLCITVLR